MGGYAENVLTNYEGKLRMVDRTEEQLKGDTIEVGRWDVYEVEVSTSDTITLGEYSTSQNLDAVKLIKKSDRSDVTTTISNNEITVTGAGLTNIKCILFAAGIEA